MSKKETKGAAATAEQTQVAEHAATWTPEDPSTCTTCGRPVADGTVHTTVHVGESAPAAPSSPSASVARAAVIEGVVDGVQTPDPISDPSKKEQQG